MNGNVREVRNTVKRIPPPERGFATRSTLPAPVSVGRSQVVYRDDVDGIDADGQLVITDDHDDLGRDENEIPVRHGMAPTIREPQGKRHEPIFEAFLELVNHCGTLLPSMIAGKRPDCSTDAVAVVSGPRRRGVGRSEVVEN